MKTKNLYIILFLGFLGIFTGACSSGGGDKTEDPRIESETGSITLPVTGGEESFKIDANLPWNVSCDAAWLTVTKTNETTVLIKAEGNVEPSRTAQVICTLDGHTESATVTVNQATAPEEYTEIIVLTSLYNATGGNRWTSKWDLSGSVSDLFGVKTDNDGKVTHLLLKKNNLNGSLPSNLGYLSKLQYCDLDSNALEGVIPASINRMTGLKALDLSANKFSGSVPDLSSLQQLEVIDLSYNQLSGEIPVWLGNLTSLEDVRLSWNDLTGTLPKGLKNLIDLNTLDLSYNNLNGTIPAEWSVLNKMEVFYLYSNQLEGNIPAFVTGWEYLRKLALDGNNLTGNIPDDLGDISTLQNLWLSHNKLTGDIPNSLLSHDQWENEWKDQIIPQQTGYGFNGYMNHGKAMVNHTRFIKPIGSKNKFFDN